MFCYCKTDITLVFERIATVDAFYCIGLTYGLFIAKRGNTLQLENYRRLMRLTRKEAAIQLGCAPNTIYRWEKGRQTPRPQDLKKIREWSVGAVTANDFCELREGKE